EAAAFVTTTAGLLRIVLFGSHGGNNELFYLLFVPLVWMAMRKGLRGASLAVLVLNVGIILVLRWMPQDAHRLVVLQFMMLIPAATGLAMGALISERNVTEAQLADEEERTRLLLESTGESIYGMDTAGAFTFCNPATLKTLGYTRREDLIGKSTHATLHHTK